MHGKKRSMAVYEMESCMMVILFTKVYMAALIGEDLLCEREPFSVVDT